MILSTGVDYMTIVYPSPHLPELIQSLMWTTTERLQREGNVPYYMQQNGYNGIRCGSLFFGERESDCMVQVSGKLSDTLWYTLAEHGGKCSRLDMHVTVLTGSYDGSVARRAAQDSNTFKQDWKKKYKVRLHDGFGDGDTCYIGSFKSLHFARVYDKDKESAQAEYKNTWRYEVVWRKENANSICCQLFKEPNYRTAIVQTVYEYFKGRGVTPLFECGEGVVLRPDPTPPPKVDSTIQWLEDSVVPVCNRLVSMGYLNKLRSLFDFPGWNTYTERGNSDGDGI